MRARWSFAIARLWLSVGAPLRAIARLEAATIMQPSWATPVVTIATLHAPSAVGAIDRMIC